MWLKGVVHTSLRSGWVVSVLAVVIAFLVGALLIAITGANILDAYVYLFKGAIFNSDSSSFVRQIKPLTDSFFYAIPLILAGLGIGFGFKAGLFNIGGAGQVIFGALAAIWVSFTFHLPAGLHLVVALAAAMLAGGVYAGIAGFLKAKTGANEVIVTIMLNSIATLAISYILSLPSWHAEGSNQPLTPIAAQTAQLPAILPAPFKLHFGLVIAIVATFVYWWMVQRSTFGFQVRAVGANPHAARTAGMSIETVTTWTMVVAGVFCGLAGANEALGTMPSANQGVSTGVAGTIGFDAITVALLGRNKPLGIFFSGLLFGALKAGGYKMQTQGVPIDMILILESVIVLLIAAPALVRFVFRLPQPDGKTLRSYVASLAEGSSASDTASGQASEPEESDASEASGASEASEKHELAEDNIADQVHQRPRPVNDVKEAQ
ncbi:MAG: ABC transporter permease [Actinomycetaceae bacterium]|nr:ABC transporter permease [Actinomycetaceae bacterium]MDY6082918.1 ABC transporter permease [Actinomycetaceae bacterium]